MFWNEPRVHSLAEDEKWKPPLIKELALLKKNFLSIDFDEEHLTEILDHVCTQQCDSRIYKLFHTVD